METDTNQEFNAGTLLQYVHDLPSSLRIWYFIRDGYVWWIYLHKNPNTELQIPVFQQ